MFILKRAEGETETTVSYDGDWQVIGVSDGQILITPVDFVVPISGGYNDYGRMYYGLKGQDGYENAITELDNISKLYGQGYGATGARSIKVEDINKVTGYNPNNVGIYDINQTGEGTKYGKGELYEYGNEVTYYWDGTDYPYYTATNALKGNLTLSHSAKFNWYENGWKEFTRSTTATTSAMEKITTLKSNYYYYYPQTLTDSNDENATIGLATGSKAYKALFTDASGNTCQYWLGYPCIMTRLFDADFEVRVVFRGDVSGHDMFHSYGKTGNGYGYAVRPAVSLKSDIQLTGNSEDGWTIVKD